jgi:RNA polymerase subunit RPABC4/transcription elongation factor Spt4
MEVFDGSEADENSKAFLQQAMADGNYGIVQGTFDKRGKDERLIGEGGGFTLLRELNKYGVMTGKKCLKCHAEFEKDAQFCSQCGAKLNAVMTYKKCPECHTPFEQDVLLCTQCGAELETVTH